MVALDTEASDALEEVVSIEGVFSLETDEDEAERIPLKNPIVSSDMIIGSEGKCSGSGGEEEV
jgi:hypothetical protein